jgi:putative transposase
MTGINVNVNPNLLPGLLSTKDGLSELLESVLNQVLEAQMTEKLGAEPHERTETREGYRNGYRHRTLYTRVGPLTLQVPQARDGSFSTEIFKRYQRSEQAFVLGLMEMFVNGVSTGKVSRITEELCGVSFSKSLVSSLTSNLDLKLRAFNERKLEASYPFILVDALFFKARENDRVLMKAALIVSGVRSDGYREILGIQLGNSESYSSWDEMFKWLKSRGLKEVLFVISDNHTGLKEAAKRNFQGSTWQHCQVHLTRNILGVCSVKTRAAVAESAKKVLQAGDLEEARRRLEAFRSEFEKSAPKAVTLLEEAFDDAMAVMALPEKYRKRLRTTNMQERLNQEVRRRERVIRIFPNEASALRLMGALLAEQNEAWLERKYLDMDDFTDWLNQYQLAEPVGNVVAFG